MLPKRVHIHDTTLRDGEQMPGVVFSRAEKLKLAEKFVEFGIDEIDIMPVVSSSESSVAAELSQRYPEVISATCRIRKEDIDQVRDLGIRKITLFAPLSDIFLNQKFGTGRRRNMRESVKCVEYASSLGLNVSFAGMDATRADFKYLLRFIRAVEKNVEFFYLADSIGILNPRSSYEFVSKVKEASTCMIGMHVHNDFSMATANTIEAIRAGADAFSGTFTGIGERAGNTPIEEVCVALKCLENTDLGVRYDMIAGICELVESYSRICLQPHKPVIGRNVFSHESGIHSDAILKSPRTFEPFEPELIGQKRRFWFGKHSGRNSLRHVLRESNVDFSEDGLRSCLDHVKSISENQKKSFSQDEVVQICRERFVA